MDSPFFSTLSLSYTLTNTKIDWKIPVYFCIYLCAGWENRTPHLSLEN